MTKTLQYVLGTILIISGMIKLNDPLGFAYKLEEYYSADVLDIPFMIKFAFVNGFMVSLAEVILGMGIIMGYKIRQSLLLSILMFVFFGFLTFYSAYFNKVNDCGCFGDAIHFTPWQSFTKDMFLMLLTIILWFKQKEIKAKRFAILSVMAIIVVGSSVSLYAISNLPIIDFRPYKIGTDIVKSMEIPEGAKQDVYKDKWFYKIDGEVKVFTTEESPWDIKDAEFVKRETELVEKGYEAPIHDFALEKDGEDYTDEILSKENVLCIVSLDLNLNDDDIAKIKPLFENNKDVIVISPSPAKVIDEFKKKLGFDVDVFSIDDTTCKTIVRANPGIVRLKKGIITEKYAL
jgi:uncharacterized membrane protein YphA (DoxX/SURF4 family)